MRFFRTRERRPASVPVAMGLACLASGLQIPVPRSNSCLQIQPTATELQKLIQGKGNSETCRQTLRLKPQRRSKEMS